MMEMKMSKQPPRRLVYIQVSAERILLRRVATGETINDVPQVAIDQNGVPTVFGQGAEDAARWRPDLRLVNGFSHPRCLLGDMEVATLTLHYFLSKLLNPWRRRWPRLRADVVIHPVGVRDLSGLEAWGLQRIAQLAGAKTVRLWLGEDPAYETLVSGVTQETGSFRALGPPLKRRR